MEYCKTLLPILDNVISIVDDEVPIEKQWPQRLQALDRKIQQMNEQITSRKSVPPDLQDEYRETIDATLLENTQLSAKLIQTTEAFIRAKTAYAEEAQHAGTLEDQLNALEQKLITVLRKGASK